MAGKIAVISGVVFAGTVGAVIIASELRGGSPADTLSSTANTVAIRDGASPSRLGPLPGGDIQTSAASAPGSGHERDEHANRNSSGSGQAEQRRGTSDEDDD